MTDRKGVIAYLIIAFGIAWVSWEIPIRWLHVDVSSSQFQLFALPGAFAPAIAALIVRAATKEGFKDAKLKLPLLSKLPYFLFALLLPLAIVAAMVFEAKVLGYLPAGFDLAKAIYGIVPAADTGEAAKVAKFANTGPWLIPTMLGMAIVTTPILWGEEFGWRGYLQPRLCPGKPVAAAIVTGVIWAVWHFPLVLRGYDYGREQALLGSAVFVVGAILLSFMFGWLVERTGSIWSSSLAHAATNGIGGALATLWFASADDNVVMSYVGVLSWVPMLVVCILLFWVGRTRSREAR
jgi:membrane protease YdiL (CAAX protease family)